jgi:hypothetical protein
MSKETSERKRQGIPAASPDEGISTPPSTELLLSVLTGKSLSDLFASRVKTQVLTLADFDETENWIEWRNLQKHALVDYTTESRDGKELYAPDPVDVGETILAPDNKFFRAAAEQGIIERVKR